MDFYDRQEQRLRTAPPEPPAPSKVDPPEPKPVDPLVGWLSTAAVLAVVAGLIWAFSPTDKTAPPESVADGDCTSAPIAAAIKVRAALTSNIDIAPASEVVAVTTGGMTYLATPFGGGDSSLVTAYPEGNPEAGLVAVNGTAQDHTDLPEGGEQEGIDLAQGCL